jgi:hypothetical protein
MNACLPAFTIAKEHTRGCMVGYLSFELEEGMMADLFGPPTYDMDIDDKGYSGCWDFIDAEGGVASVYFRHGMARLGGWDTSVADRLDLFLKETFMLMDVALEAAEAA